MAKATIAIDPVTRIEGHLKAQVVVENGKVVDAHLTGGMFRGFEQILKGRDPRDSTQIVQRICGVCPTSHAMASALAQEDAFNIKVTGNGRVTRNLILGANYLQSHILHFYHLAALDFVAGPDTAPFVPRFAQPDLRLPPLLRQQERKAGLRPHDRRGRSPSPLRAKRNRPRALPALRATRNGPRAPPA